MARFALIEFEKEEDAEEFVEGTSQSFCVSNYRTEDVFEVRNVMLLAGEGDKEDKGSDASDVAEDLDSGGLTSVCSV